MDNAHQSYEDFLGQEDWLQPEWAGELAYAPQPCADPQSDELGNNDFLSSGDPYLSNVIDINWNLSSEDDSQHTTQWPHGGASIDRPDFHWPDVCEFGFDQQMSIDGVPGEPSQSHPYSSSVSVETTTILEANSTTSGLENHTDNSKENASGKSKSLTLNVFNKYLYPKKTCATCDSPLDTNEQLLNFESYDIYCTRSKAADHLPLVCDHDGCGMKFRTLLELKSHSDFPRHKALCCAAPGCGQLLSYFYSYDSHWLKFHEEKYSCAQCGEVFDYKSFLDDHGSATMHAAYVCRYPKCGSESTRFADLLRHQLTHKADVPRHPCPHCRNYRGKNGFKRRDHLRQHIRNYHRIEDSRNGSSLFTCRDKACKDDYGDALALQTLDELTDHMRTRHSSSTYVCEVIGCDRVLMNGFETDKLLKVHLKKDHPSAFQCNYPGCDRVGTKGWMRERDMVKHMKNVHGITG